MWDPKRKRLVPSVNSTPPSFSSGEKYNIQVSINFTASTLIPIDPGYNKKEGEKNQEISINIIHKIVVSQVEERRYRKDTFYYYTVVGVSLTR